MNTTGFDLEEVYGEQISATDTLIEEIKHMAKNNVKDHSSVFYSTDEIMAKLYKWAALDNNNGK